MGGYYGGNAVQNTQAQLPENLQYQPQQEQGYAAWPGHGQGGMPGAHHGALMGGFGGMSNYGFGGSPFGYGGSPFAYGPGSYSPWSAGAMGYGGGGGMHGPMMSAFGPWSMFSGFNPNAWAQQQQQQQADPSHMGDLAGTGGIKSAPGAMQPYDPNSVNAAVGTALNPTPPKPKTVWGPHRNPITGEPPDRGSREWRMWMQDQRGK
jgi:hypothetical protein